MTSLFQVSTVRPSKLHVGSTNLLAFSLLCTATGIVHAQTLPSTPSSAALSITVTSPRETEGYTVKSITSATKTETALVDTSQSITIITEKLMKDQAMQSMADVTRYLPGVGMANGEGNRDSPVFRGSNSASGDFYIDGIRDDVEYYRDLYNVERIEALTGPAAMIFGRGGSGGVINRVTKQADGKRQGVFDLTFGSYRNRRLTIDAGQPIGDAALRVTALAEDSGGYQRNAEIKRSGINPTLLLRTGQATSIVLGLEHFQDDRVTDRGVPSLNGRPENLPVDAFFGDPERSKRPVTLRADAFTAVVDHTFKTGAQLTNRTRYTDYDKFYQNYNAGAVNTSTQQVAISAYNNHQWRKNAFNQTDLVFDLVAGEVKHKILIGLEVGRQTTDYLRKTGTFNNGTQTTINVPLAAADAPLPVRYVLGATTSDRDGRSQATIAGIYAQDQLELSKAWQLIAGLRLDRFALDYHNNATSGLLAPTATSPADLSSRDTLVSPRLGVLYKPWNTLSFYANYSVASFPRGGDQLSSLTTVNKGLKPEKFINLELGGKWEINPILLATMALYRLDRTNVAVTNPVTGIADQLVDGAGTDGVEVGIGGNITKHWSINGGYAYQDARLTATALSTALKGNTVQNVPKNTFALWNRYDVNPTFGAGLGVIYRSASYASTSNVVQLPAFTRLDAALFYKIAHGFAMQLNVENVDNKKYYTYANGDNNITPGSPRAVRLSVHAAF